MNFSKETSNINFKNSAVVPLKSTSNSKVIITNFPTSSTPTYTPKGREANFKITENGLVDYIPIAPSQTIPQEIKFANVANLSFNIDTKKLIVTSTGNVHLPNLKNTIYFLFKLRDTSGNIKSYSSIKANENANKFANDLNDISFEIDDIIELSSFTNNVIEIKNFPTIGKNEFINKAYFQQDTYQGFFKITDTGLTTYTPTTILPTTTLPNTIKINDINNTDLIHINFNTLDKVFDIVTLRKFADSTSEYTYVLAKLYDENNTLIYTTSLPSNNLLTSISLKLNLHMFDFNYFLDLTYDHRARPNILVTNLNGKDHVPKHSNERYKITAKGLEFIPIFLPNIITIKGLNDKTVSTIEFDFSNNKIKATSFNEIADSSSSYNYFRISFYHLTDRALGYPIYAASLTSNTNPAVFVRAINTMLFIEDNVIKITCNTRALNKVSISNFPNKDDNHIFATETEYYKVTNTGLVAFTPQSNLANNIITAKSQNGIYINAFTIAFDPDSMVIKSTATGAPIGRLTKGWDLRKAFEYTFKDTNGKVIKTNYVYADDKIGSTSGSAVPLANDLNNLSFGYGQTLKIYAPVKEYRSIFKGYITMSDIPFSSNEYWKFNDTETVKITPLGLVLQSDSPLANKQLLQNIIILKNSANKLAVQIYFDMTDKKLRVSTSSFPMGKLSDNTELAYFIFILKDSSGTQKTIARIFQNSNPDDFTAALNEYSFEYGDSINMQSANLNKILIMNYAKYENDYSPRTNYEEFTITKLGLVSSLKFLKNEISFLGYENNLISKIYFDVTENKLVVNSTGTTAHTSFKNEYFAIVLKDTSGNIINEASVKGIENANSFAVTLTDTPLQFGYSITARFKEKGRFLVSNYPIDGATYKSSNDVPKTFIITKDGLVSPPVKNIITFLGLNSALIATIEFDFSLKQLVVKSTGNPAHLNFPGQKYFTFILKDSHDTLIKEASVNGNENANTFAATLNATPFQFGYTITARFIHNNRFIISDYPVANDTYHPSNISPKTFIITKDGLVSAPPKNIIIFLGYDNNLIVTVEFDFTLNQLVVKSTGITAHRFLPGKEYFAIVLKDTSGTTINEASVKGEETANNFATTLNGTYFKIGYTITVRFTEKDKFSVSDYPTANDTYNSPDDNPKIFTIISTGLLLNP